MGDDAKKDAKRLEQAIQTIQEHLKNAEAELAELGDDVQFLVGDGDIEIVRRGPTGETKRPKRLLATLMGCDPMLWRPEHPAWMRSLMVRSWREPEVANEGNGQPPQTGAAEEQIGGSKPPANTDDRS